MPDAIGVLIDDAHSRAGPLLLDRRAPGGLQTKARMLSIERARIGGAPGLFDDLPLAVRPRRPGG